MKIVSWNVNGIRSVHKKSLFVPAMQQLRPDIFCLQETKAEQHQSELVVPGYDEYWNSAGRKGYSGTAVFTAIKPHAVTLDLPANFEQKFRFSTDPYGNPNTEGRVLAAEYKHFYVVNVYTPNSKDDLSRIPLRHKKWDPAFLTYCKQLNKLKPVIMCGDFNVAHTPDDLANPKTNDGKKGFTKEEREGIDAILDAGFVDTFRLFTKGKGHYTWWSPFARSRERNVGWRIDYIFLSDTLKDKVTHARIHENIFGSDHCPISIDIDL